MTTATSERRKEAICSPWCDGHDGRYQGWETHASDSRQQRDHSGNAHRTSNVTVELAVVEEEDHTLTPAMVALYVDGIGACDRADLTAAEALELAYALLDAA